MSEQLLQASGIAYVFMDTDSVVPFHPEGMAGEEFRRRVRRWSTFVSVYPYPEGGSLLGYEDQNYAIDEANPNVVTRHGAARVPCDQRETLRGV